ncbi:MAG TPA: IPT/TIG domain-containing protein [Pyrinomonadaceae bacterium]|nr:IPT/TIG domain-containing protein [Pyrinomonadaceae bacterium]
MAATKAKESSDQKKIFMAIGLGLLAIIALWWTFFGFGSSSKLPAKVSKPPVTAPPVPRGDERPTETPLDSPYIAIVTTSGPGAVVPEPRRNIFAFYVPPPSPVPTQSVVIPTPPPPPPLVLAAVSPANVYARTEDFTLEVTGDKFTPAVHIIVDNRELPTRFVSAQQLSATVPAAMIANPGSRSVVVKSPDGVLYSRQDSINVQAPPTPNYGYVGVLVKSKHIGDTAILQDKSNKEILTVQRGDVVGGRFRVTSISDRELVLVDTSLKIKHSIAMSMEGERASFPQGRPTPRVAAEDDEPQ